MDDTGNAYKILIEKTEGKEPPQRYRRRWEDNIRNDLREMRWDGMHASGSEHRSVVGFCEYGNETSGSIKKE